MTKISPKAEVPRFLRSSLNFFPWQSHWLVRFHKIPKDLTIGKILLGDQSLVIRPQKVYKRTASGKRAPLIRRQIRAQGIVIKLWPICVDKRERQFVSVGRPIKIGIVKLITQTLEDSKGGLQRDERKSFA